MLDTWEPKASPNAGSLELRPPTQSAYRNLLFAAVWTQSTKEMFRMETAAANGAEAARVILDRERATRVGGQRSSPTGGGGGGGDSVGKSPASTRPPRKSRPGRAFPWLLAPARAADRLAFFAGLPHPSAAFFGSSLLMLAAAAAAILVATFWWIAFGR
jgi:hypothetical protein